MPRIILAILIVLPLTCACGSRSVSSAGDAPALSPTLDAATLTFQPAPAAAPTNTRTLMPPPVSTATATATPDAIWTATATLTAAATATASRTPTDTPAPTPTSGPTPDGVARTLSVPILMYHYISEPPPEADAYRRDLSVTPERFAEHLRYLKEAGYTTVTLDDLLYALAQGQPLPPKPIILTFDDGYEDGYQNAFPILRDAGSVATFFIMTDLVTDEAAGYMTWPQIEEMAKAGQLFGSHGRQDHRSLQGRSLDYLVWVALGSKEAIEEHLGYHPRWVAYPSGEYDAQTIAVFKSAGYWGGLTINQGVEHSLDKIFELRRIRVRGSHTSADLARLLAVKW